MIRAGIISFMLGLVAAPAFGQAPFVDGVATPENNTYDRLVDDVWVPIPGTEKTVDLPSGKGILTVIMGTAEFAAPPNEDEIQYRAVVGTDAFPLGQSSGGSGTFVLETTGGVTTIGLQQFRVNGSGDPAVGTDMWTLTVFPDTFEGVPAVSTWGLAALALLLLTGGSFIVLANRAATPSTQTALSAAARKDGVRP